MDETIDLQPEPPHVLHAVEFVINFVVEVTTGVYYDLMCHAAEVAGVKPSRVALMLPENVAEAPGSTSSVYRDDTCYVVYLHPFHWMIPKNKLELHVLYESYFLGEFNNYDAWYTLLHELAHVRNGDCDRFLWVWPKLRWVFKSWYYRFWGERRAHAFALDNYLRIQ